MYVALGKETVMTGRRKYPWYIRVTLYTIRLLAKLLWWTLRFVGRGLTWFWKWLNTHSGKPTLREQMIEITEKTTGRQMRRELKERGHNE